MVSALSEVWIFGWTNGGRRYRVGLAEGFMLPTGLAIVNVSQKAMDAGKGASTPRDYFCYANIANERARIFPVPHP